MQLFSRWVFFSILFSARMLRFKKDIPFYRYKNPVYKAASH